MNIPKIKSWVHRPFYSIAEDSNGFPCGVLYPVEIETHQRHEEHVISQNKTLTFGRTNLPPEIMFKSFK